jgi:tetratricopeptide (TPR) repeat protein
VRASRWHPRPARKCGAHTNLAQLAEACGKAGRFEEGLEVIGEALDVVKEKGERWWEAEIIRLGGELLLKRNPSGLAEAQTSFEQAIEIAPRQDAKSLALRATMSLERLLDQSGRRDEARTVLAGIYNWFTEGFDTADLIDAKAPARRTVRLISRCRWNSVSARWSTPPVRTEPDLGRRRCYDSPHHVREKRIRQQN